MHQAQDTWENIFREITRARTGARNKRSRYFKQCQVVELPRDYNRPTFLNCRRRPMPWNKQNSPGTSLNRRFTCFFATPSPLPPHHCYTYVNSIMEINGFSKYSVLRRNSRSPVSLLRPLTLTSPQMIKRSRFVTDCAEAAFCS